MKTKTKASGKLSKLSIESRTRYVLLVSNNSLFNKFHSLLSMTEEKKTRKKT